MEESKKGGTLPGNVSGPVAAAPAPISTPGAARPELASPARRKQRLGGDSEQEPAATRARVRKDANELKFEGIRVLSNLPDGGKFLLMFEAPDGNKGIINGWP